MVVNGSDEIDKLEIERRIIQAGGSVRQSPPRDDEESGNDESVNGRKRFLAIAGKNCGIRLNNLKKHDKVDIVNLEWLLDSEATSCPQDLEPR